MAIGDALRSIAVVAGATYLAIDRDHMLEPVEETGARAVGQVRLKLADE